MNILILGGNSTRHQQWIREVQQALEPLADKVRIHDYRHWESSDAEADVEHEVQAVTQTAQDLGEYIIVAKSIGTVIAALGVASEKLAPKACLFMGVPLAIATEHFPTLGEIYQKLPPTIFLQNSHDPLGSAEDVKNFVENTPLKDWQLTISEGDTHDYSDMQLIRTLVTKIIR